VHVHNYGAKVTRGGQVRTNQFLNAMMGDALVWSLREFKLVRTCGAGTCSALTFRFETVKGNPFGPLFNADGRWPARQRSSRVSHFRDAIEARLAESRSTLTADASFCVRRRSHARVAIG
jgi:hypothetical protein